MKEDFEAKITGDDKPPVYHSCPVTQNFEFEVCHVITCNQCNEVVTKTEQFYDLSVDMPKKRDASEIKSIQYTIDQFFRDEKIEYDCSECHYRQATVTHKFTRLPRILILHLKRYSYNLSTLKNTKLAQNIRIPNYLTLSLHCTTKTEVPLSAERKPVLCSVVKQENNFQSKDCTDAVPAVRKRLYSDSSRSEDNKSRFNFKRVRRKSDDSDRTEENKDSEDLSKLSEAEQVAKVLEISKQECANPSLLSLSEEQQVAAVLELSKQEMSHCLVSEEMKENEIKATLKLSEQASHEVSLTDLHSRVIKDESNCDDLEDHVENGRESHDDSLRTQIKELDRRNITGKIENFEMQNAGKNKNTDSVLNESNHKKPCIVNEQVPLKRPILSDTDDSDYCDVKLISPVEKKVQHGTYTEMKMAKLLLIELFVKYDMRRTRKTKMVHCTW
uniref:Ubiquitin carboxyl-terminal hydrolase 37-like n=1 Tax=Saccoglossus kowalevskii TaxID=10224 RepID=A0ABM0MYW0_SACKO|nr:PREDICTED: ubiquitin carboxyl-terminal hydrolase 37-like [Saccoglossus kowalevskii]